MSDAYRELSSFLCLAHLGPVEFPVRQGRAQQLQYGRAQFDGRSERVLSVTSSHSEPSNLARC